MKSVMPGLRRLLNRFDDSLKIVLYCLDPGHQPTLATLDQEPLLMFSEDYALTKRLRTGFIQAGVEPVIVAQSGQWDFLLSMAMAGLGTALMPEPLLKRLRLPADVVIRPLCEPEVSWRVGQVWVPDRHMSHAARAWLAVCAEGSALPLF